MRRTNLGFNFIKAKSLDKALQPTEAQRLLYKDIVREESFSNLLTAGAKYAGTASISYLANASFGTFSLDIDLDYGMNPLAMVWYIGTINNATGAIMGDEACLLDNTEENIILNANYAKYLAYRDKLTISINTSNLGIATSMAAYFYYAVFHEDLADAVPELQRAAE